MMVLINSKWKHTDDLTETEWTAIQLRNMAKDLDEQVHRLRLQSQTLRKAATALLMTAKRSTRRTKDEEHEEDEE